jgi:hypothetical protein
MENKEIWYQQIRIAMTLMSAACEKIKNCDGCPCEEECREFKHPPEDWGLEYYLIPEGEL